LDVPDTTVGRDVLALAERGDIGGASFAFTLADDGDEWSGDHRTLRNVVLHEISVVQSWPAYPDTHVDARARSGGQWRVSLGRRWLAAIGG
jgi:Escherichia/Staphylococcus phage prohead protease